jgi:hypothetical protein
MPLVGAFRGKAPTDVRSRVEAMTEHSGHSFSEGPGADAAATGRKERRGATPYVAATSCTPCCAPNQVPTGNPSSRLTTNTGTPAGGHYQDEIRHTQPSHRQRDRIVRNTADVRIHDQRRLETAFPPDCPPARRPPMCDPPQRHDLHSGLTRRCLVAQTPAEPKTVVTGGKMAAVSCRERLRGMRAGC